MMGIVPSPLKSAYNSQLWHQINLEIEKEIIRDGHRERKIRDGHRERKKT